MRIALAQYAPAFFDRSRTLAEVTDWIGKAATAEADLVCFAEALVPGYPLWLCRTGGAAFDDPTQKRLFARYSREAVCVEAGDLDTVCEAAARHGVSVVLGIVERPASRGHSLFCSRVIIAGRDDDEAGTHAGQILSVHRKLMPTYEERLVWAPGDGAGLVTHHLGEFRVGALNCWENWMPLARSALYQAGEDLHVMVWPGCLRLTELITPFVAREGRSYAASVGAVLRPRDIPADIPELAALRDADEAFFYDGGSGIAGPDGAWIVEPVVGEGALITADLDLDRVREERQNFDPAGHYARPEILNLLVDENRYGH